MSINAATADAPLTPFQTDTLELICKGNEHERLPADRVIDLDQLLDRLANRGRVTTKQSLQFMIRTLVTKGVIVKKPVGKRRGHERVGYVPTTKGLQVGGPRGPEVPVFYEPETSPLDEFLLSDGL